MISGHDHGNVKNIIVISADRNMTTQSVYDNFQSNKTLDTLSKDFLVSIIDKLGEESSKAQKLQIPITTSNKFTANSNDDLIFIMFCLTKQTLKEIGFIRFGKRDLYFDDGTSLKHLVDCPCILDFYTRLKRCGYGKILFDLVLKQLNINPQVLAYDRPSYSMLSFLRRHYSLDQPLWQHNHFSEKMIAEDVQEEIKPNFFGIKSYLHNFYENVSFKNPNEYDDNDTNFSTKENQKSKLWTVVFIFGLTLMLLGAIMISIGFTFIRMKIDIGYQEEMRIIDKSAYEFNEHLDQIKIIGLICFATGGLIVASSLMLPGLLSNNENDGYQDESTHLKVNIDNNNEEETRIRAKNLIPVTEELKIVQPKQANTTIITNSGLKQIELD